jgi:hypothetical protein
VAEPVRMTKCDNRHVRIAKELRTSGAMYSGVPQAVLHTEPESSSLEYPKSHILMMGSGRLPSSSTLSSCSGVKEHRRQRDKRTVQRSVVSLTDGQLLL